MRLIDADEFMENLIYCDGLGRRGLEAVLKTLKEQPTAYDISKVVEELEENKQWYETHGCNVDLNVGVISATNHAIDVVRKGGAE